MTCRPHLLHWPSAVWLCSCHWQPEGPSAGHLSVTYSRCYLTPDKFGFLTMELVEKRSQYKFMQVFYGQLRWFMHHDITNSMWYLLVWHLHLHHQKRPNGRQIRLLYNEHWFHRIKYWIVHYQNNLHAYRMFNDTEISYSTVIQSVHCREGVLFSGL